jgi:Stage II sporulation protein E (SpoIIE)
MKSFLLPLPHQPSVSGLLAVRVWCEPPSLNSDPCGFVDSRRPPWIGDAALARQAPTQEDEHFMVISGFQVAASLLALLAGIISLIVYLRGRRNPVYLWFAVFLVGAAIAECPNYFFPFENWADLILAFAVGVQIGGFLLLLVWLLGVQHERWILRTFAVVAAVIAIDWGLTGILQFFGAHAGAAILDTYAAVAYPQNFTALLPLPLLMFAMSRKRAVREWPVIAVATLYFAVALITDLGIQWPALAWANDIFYLGYVAYWPNLVLFVLLLLTLAFSVYRHFVAEQRQQEHSARELHAAQEVQRVLLPDKVATIPGFAIASVYRPASEVGGDFFQILPLESGATLVVIGDVSGKGLKAAMIVSLIVGTLRTIATFTQEPAEILQQLNARLHGRMPGGFVTCLVLRIDVSGEIVAAHAGHIFPYIDGKEFALAGSVPLSIMTETDYEQTELHLAKGETLTLLTDGVPEAQNAKRELFGFDRLVALLGRKPTAEQVAETACTFGQKDDITVLTLTRLVQADDMRDLAFNMAQQEA